MVSREPPGPGLAKRAGFFIRLGMTGLIFWLIFARLDTGRLREVLAGVQWPWYALGFAAVLSRVVAASAAMNRLLRSVNVFLPYRRVLKINFFSIYFSSLSQVAGGALRWSLFSGSGRRRGEALFVILMERYLRVCVNVIFFWAAFWAGGAVPLGSVRRGALTVFVGCLSAAMLGALAVICCRPASRWFERYFAAPSGGRLRDFLKKKAADLIRVWRQFQNHPRLALEALGGFAAAYCFALGIFFAVARSVGVVVPPVFLVMVIALMAILQHIPLTVYGLGIREGVLVYFLPLIDGVLPEQALAIGFLAFFLAFLEAVTAGIWYFLDSFKGFGRTGSRSRQREEAQDAPAGT